MEILSTSATASHIGRNAGQFWLKLTAVVLLLPSPQPAHTATSILDRTVVKAADGDTITVLDSYKERHRVRITGMDAPEKGQPIGNASRKSLAAIVAEKEVRVEFQTYDRYGRIVGKVCLMPSDCPTCDKTLDVGLAQVTSDMAGWYRYYAHEQSRDDQRHFEFAEQEPRAKKARLWWEKDPEPP